MMNDGYPPDRFDPLRSALRWSSMLPSFTSSCQAAYRLARLKEAQNGSMSMNGTGSMRDERDERLARAGYLLVVGTDRLVRAVAARVWSIACTLIRQGATRRQIGARPSASRRST